MVGLWHVETANWHRATAWAVARSGGWAVCIWLAVTTSRAWAGPISAGDLLSSTAAEGRTDLPELQDAIDKYDKRDFDAAYEAVKKACEAHPELGPPRTMMARMHLAAGQSAAGISTMEQAASEHADDPEAFLLLGDVAFSAGRFVECQLLFEKASALVQGYAGDAKRKVNLESRTHAGMASLAESRQDWKLAQQHLEAWLKLDAESAPAHFRLGKAKFFQDPQQPKEAFAELELAYAKAKDKLPPPGVTMMQMYQQLGDEAKARDWAKFTINKSPDSILAQLAVAAWCLQVTKFDEAKQHADEALKLDPNSIDAKLMRGIVARFVRNYDEAEQHLDAAKLQSPSNFTANNQLALVLIESKDESKRRRALELANLNFQSNQGNVEAAWTLGWVLFKSGRLNEARQLMQNALALNRPLTPDMAYYMARLSNDLGRAENVRKFLDLALESKAPFAYRQEAQEWRQQLPEESAGGN